MRTPETVLTRNKADYISTLVHDEWLETVIAGHEEPYKDWADYAAWLIIQTCLPQQGSKL